MQLSTILPTTLSVTFLFERPRVLRPGGYGVLLPKHLVDELMYSEKGNEVLLVKYLRASSGTTQTL